jgi:hypothetical protein
MGMEYRERERATKPVIVPRVEHGWETMIIQGDISALSPDSTKYQIVVRAGDVEQGLSMYLKTRFAFQRQPQGKMRCFGRN